MERFAWMSFLSPLLLVAACAPSLTPPGESVRVQGIVRDRVAAPLAVEVYERCSPHLYFFERCPGRLLGETRIARPGSFLVEVDPETDEVSVIAFRGVMHQEEACAVESRPTSALGETIELELAQEPCPVQRPLPPTGSARAPISGF